ncbi:hypothetical protein N7478_001811 [Penicillium angulare]|uniref:uncharacterized protein n=1 Tax=Penicillium angulare TaxID=116970 RepID=UPI00253FD792|nr:uncharacterized protein N7478_001811 [Penicillium angulare]KAJ5288781.1 hypothetical protein N7478_001811 [Penicillium angulare]
MSSGESGKPSPSSLPWQPSSSSSSVLGGSQLSSSATSTQSFWIAQGLPHGEPLPFVTKSATSACAKTADELPAQNNFYPKRHLNKEGAFPPGSYKPGDLREVPIRPNNGDFNKYAKHQQGVGRVIAVKGEHKNHIFAFHDIRKGESGNNYRPAEFSSRSEAERKDKEAREEAMKVEEVNEAWKLNLGAMKIT